MNVRNTSVISFIIITAAFFLHIVNISHFFRTALSVLCILFLPGYIILKLFVKLIKLQYHEVVPVSIGLSISIATFLGVYLSFVSVPITPVSIYISLLLLCLVSYAFCRHRDSGKSLDVFLNSFARKFRRNAPKVLMLFLVGASGVLLLIDDILRENLFHGYDPFLTKPLTLLIVRENLSPLSFLYKTSIHFSGFFYFSAVFHSSTGISLYDFTRYGGPIFLSFFLITLFILLYRIFQSKWVMLVPFFYATNPFVVDRFLMTIAENFSLMILGELIFVLVVLYRNKIQAKYEMLIPGMLFGTILMSHFLVSLFAVFLVLSVVLVSRIKRQLVLTKFSFLVIVIGFLFSFPYWAVYGSFIIWEIIIESQVILGGARNMTIPSWAPSQAMVKSKWSRPIYLNDFSYIELVLLPIGLVYIARNRHNLLTFRSLFFLLPWISAISLGILYSYAGGIFSVVRVTLYVALVVALFSAIGLWQVVRLLRQLTARLKKRFLHKTITTILISFLILIVLISNAILAIKYDKWVPYGPKQLAAAEWLRDAVKDNANVVVVPFEWDDNLLFYADVSHMLTDLALIEKLMSAKDFEELNSTIHLAYPYSEYSYFFISKRWGSYIRQQSLTILDNLARRSFLVYDNDVWILETPLYGSIKVQSEDLMVIDMSNKILWMDYLVLNSWGTSQVKGGTMCRATDGAWVEWTFTVPTMLDEIDDVVYDLSIVFWGNSSPSEIFLKSSEKDWVSIGTLDPDHASRWESATMNFSNIKLYDSYPDAQGTQITFGIGDKDQQIWVAKTQIRITEQ